MKGFAPGWQVRCCSCGLTFDAADLGMVFVGKVVIGKQYKLLWCQQCRWVRWLSVENHPPHLPAKAGARCDLATHSHVASHGAGMPWGLFCIGWFFASAPLGIALPWIIQRHGRHIAVFILIAVAWESIAFLAALSVVRPRGLTALKHSR